MDFSNATLLSFDRANKFFDSDFRFGADTSYSVQGYLLNLSNDIGLSEVLEASEFFRTGLQDYQDININGDNFGKGRVTNFNVDESNFVKYTTYTVDIQGFESGNLHNITSDYYDGLKNLTGFIQASHLLEDFSEDFSFSRGTDSYSYNHDVTIKYASGDNILISPIDRAKLLATYILTGSNPSFGFIDNQTSGLYTGNYKEYFNESYDAINNSVTVSKRFDTTNVSGDYGITLRHSFDRNEAGITNVSENANIKVHETPKKTALNTAINSEIAKSYNRCAEVYGFYLGDGNLSSQPTTLNQSRNNFAGDGNYAVTYTNDPALNNDYIWRYTHQIDKDGPFYTVSEQGDVQGLGSKSTTKYNNALSAYSTIKGGIESRVTAFYNDAVGNNDLNLVSNVEGKNKFNGEINYTNEYSDDPTRNVDGLKKLEIDIEDAPPVDFANKYEILGFKELVQSIGTTTLGQRTATFNAVGYRESDLDSILTILNGKVNNYIPDGNDVFVGDVNYSFNQNDKVCNLNVLWNYNRVSRESEVL